MQKNGPGIPAVSVHPLRIAPSTVRTGPRPGGRTPTDRPDIIAQFNARSQGANAMQPRTILRTAFCPAEAATGRPPHDAREGRSWGNDCRAAAQSRCVL